MELNKIEKWNQEQRWNMKLKVWKEHEIGIVLENIELEEGR